MSENVSRDCFAKGLYLQHCKNSVAGNLQYVVTGTPTQGTVQLYGRNV